MSAPPKDRGGAPPAQWPLKPSAASSGKSAASEKGKVVHDDRGNAKWDLGLDTSRVKKLTTSQLLKQLDVSELSLLDEEPADDRKARTVLPGGAVDPYATAAPKPKPGALPDPAARPMPGKPRR